MNLFSIYKPNPKNSGHAMSVSISMDTDVEKGKFPSIMVEIVKQSSWDSNRKIGSFKHKEGATGVKTMIKLNEFEVGDIIYSIEKGKTFNAFHKFNETTKSIKISTEGTKRTFKGQEDETVRLVKMSISDSGKGFYLLLTSGESQILIEGLKYYLKKLFHLRDNA